MNYREQIIKYRSCEKYLKEFSRGKYCKIALGFPNKYSVGMASLGFQVVYSLINTNEKACAHRFFLPDEETREIITIEEEQDIKKYNAIAFSVAFEMDYLNILKILKTADIPLLRQDRGESVPLVFVGGAITLINPFALSEFVDFFILGDGENIIDFVLDILSLNLEKKEKLKLLSENSHIYVPEFPKDNYEKNTIKDLHPYISHSVITTPYGEFGDTVLFEISRGCGRGCHFCAAGHIQKPFRLRHPVIDGGEEFIPKYNSYGIVGAAVFDSPYAKELCNKIIENNAKFSLSSIRLETINEEKLDLMKKGKVQTITIAPEAGTERLREFIGKKCSDETIFNAIDMSFKSGFRKFKLYFMIGLPSETDADIEGIISLVSALAEKYPKAHFSPSCGSFVPKPHTKYEGVAMDKEDNLKRKLDKIKKSLNKIKNVLVSFESPRIATVQAILSRGNEILGRDYLLCALENNYTYAGRKYKENIENILYIGERKEFVWSKLNIGEVKK